jgi:hypothetical protein
MVLNDGTALKEGTALRDGTRLLEVLGTFGTILAIKLYRLGRGPGPDVPYIPCLDHEAMLHEHVQRHGSVYVQEAASGDLHEIVFTPDARRLQIDTVSTWGEHSPESRARLVALLAQGMPDYRVDIIPTSRWRGDRRVAIACLAQVSLRDVLIGQDIPAIKAGIERLQAVAGMMEKHSRVGSWGVRTATGPLLAAAGVVTYLGLGAFSTSLGDVTLTWLRYGIIGALGAAFLYYGIKAVHLTEMSNRVWKRTAEYNLILSERRRLGR